jgi:hypothetical protein
MTNTVFREFLGYLMSKSSKGNNFFFSGLSLQEKDFYGEKQVGLSGPMAIIYKSYIGQVLKTVNIYVNIGTNRYFKIIPQRN